MAINIIISNSLDVLAEKFTEKIEEKDRDIFRKEVVVTQTKGIEKWLSLYVAKNSENKIFANFNYENPNGFIDKYLLKNLDNSYEDSFFHPGNMKWEIFNILQSDLINDEDLKQIKEYIRGNEIKCLRLSHILADLFDQYFIYRPEMIASWKRGELWVGTVSDREKFNAIQKWQLKVFNKLLESNVKKSEKRKDRVELKEQFLHELDDEFLKKLNKIKRVSFFGLSIITQYHYDIIDKLSDHFPCDFYLLNPSGEFWYDLETDKSILKKLINNKQVITDKSENDFLANYGRSGQEFYKILFSNDDVFLKLENETFDERFAYNLLGFVQSSIFYVNPHESIGDNERKEFLFGHALARDKKYNPLKSINISSCFTPFREVEVLYDHLCEIFNSDETIKPSDVVVMITDVEKYAPYIEAVFSQKNSGKSLPFSIADKTFKGTDTVFDVIESIVNLNRGNFEAETIMNIVENRFVTQKYGFEDYEKIRSLINAANIRWGLDEQSVSKDGVYDLNRFNSWEFGLTRVILGYAMQTDEEVYGTLPLDIVEGSEALDGLRLYKLINDIKWFFGYEKRLLSLSDWAKFFKDEFFDRFIALDFSEQNMKQDFDALFINFRSDTIKVNFKIVQDDFMRLFSEAKSDQGFYSGKITFCSMVPMRSIPHKVVAMLGMNESDFPGRKNRITFDLIDAHRMVGDRDTKLSNRYLFLEAIVSAQNYLYMSYVGKSAKNNSVLNPSPAIDDLLTYIAEIVHVSYEEVKETLVKEFPLYGYGEKYRQGDFTTFISDNDIGDSNKELSPLSHSESETVMYKCESISSIVNFFKDASKWYCNTILGVYFNEEEMLLRNEETFDVDNLTKWQVNDSLVKAENSAKVIHHFQKYSGEIPLGTVGEIYVENREDELKELIQSLQDKRANRVRTTFQIEHGNISGNVTLYDDVYISYSVSSTPYKNIVEHYIYHLFLSVNEVVSESIFIDKQGNITNFNIVSKEEAFEKISAIISFIEAKSNSPLPYNIEYAFTFKNKKIEDQTLFTLNKIFNTFKNQAYKVEYTNRMLPHFIFDEDDYDLFLEVCDLVDVVFEDQTILR